MDFEHRAELKDEYKISRAELEAHDVPHLHSLQLLDPRYADIQKQDVGTYLGRHLANLTKKLTIDDSLELMVFSVKGWHSAFYPDKVRINK